MHDMAYMHAYNCDVHMYHRHRVLSTSVYWIHTVTLASSLSCLTPPLHCMYSQVDQFLESLIKFDKENIADPTLKAVRPYLEDKEFDPDFIRSKSAAAAGTVNLCR